MRVVGFVLTALFCSMIFGSSANAQTLSPERIAFRTNVGDIVVALYPKQAPTTVAQVLNLARLGVFDGAKVFRIEPGFVAQIENFDSRTEPLTESQQQAVFKIPLEVNGVHHRRGILSMARYDDPNSAETSFSFVLGDAAHLDGKYTAFGEIVSGLDVLTEMEKHPTTIDTPTASGASAGSTVATASASSATTKIVSAISAGVATSTKKPEPITILHTDVYDAGTLAKAEIAPAHPWAPEDGLERKLFLIFAICAFAFTILKPMVQTLTAR